MDINKLELVNGWYRGPERNWEMRRLGFYPRGLGDLIANNLTKIFEEGDTSDFAYELLEKCAVLLKEGKRWPDEMNKEPRSMYKTYIGSYFGKYKWAIMKALRSSKNHYRIQTKYRSQNSITRDPWVLFYATAIALNRRDYLYMKPQWFLFRPKLWALRRAALGKWNAYKFWRWVGDTIAIVFPRKDFVEDLERYRNWIYDNRVLR